MHFVVGYECVSSLVSQGVSSLVLWNVQDYALDFKTLAIIEAVVIGAFEYKRFENIKKTGEVRGCCSC